MISAQLDWPRPGKRCSATPGWQMPQVSEKGAVDEGVLRVDVKDTRTELAEIGDGINQLADEDGSGPIRGRGSGIWFR